MDNFNRAAYDALSAGASHAFAQIVLLTALALFYLALIQRFAPQQFARATQIARLPYWPLYYPLKRLLSKANALPSWTLLLAVALLLRLPGMFQSLWYDEAFSAAIANSPSWANFTTAVSVDVWPPLGYLPFWLWSRVVDVQQSEAVLRLPSLLAGMALILLCHQLALKLGFNRAEALTVSLIVALLPSAIYFSNEARGYTFLACALVIALTAMAADQPNDFFLIGITLPLWHVYGLFYLAFAGLGALVYWRGASRWWAAVVLTGLFAALWLPVVIAQSVDVADGFWTPAFTWADLSLPLATTLATSFIRQAGLLPVYVGTVALVLLAFVRRDNISRWGIVVWGVILGVPLTAATLSAVWGHNIFLDRALFPCGVLMALPLARLFQQRGVELRAFAFTLILLAIPLMKPRPELRDHFAHCRDAASGYFTEIPAAIIGRYYLRVPIVVWEDAGDQNQTLPQAAWSSYGLTAGEFPNEQTVCSVNYTTPQSAPQENQQVEAVLSQHAHTLRWSGSTAMSHTEVYRFP